MKEQQEPNSYGLKLIKSKKLTTTQVVSIINIVANAYVIYAMYICDFNPSIIKELDDKVAKLIRMKAGISLKSGNTLLYAPLEQGGLGLIKLADKMTNIKITGRFRQLKGNSIAELVLRYTLFNKKQDNSDRTTWLKLLENEGLSINKKYNNM